MLDAIRFTAPAVARKDYVPELTHFSIEGGRITGFNGQMALSAPIGVDLTVRPRATAFLAAVRACRDDTIALHVTDAGRLAVRAGKFRAYVPCTEAHAEQFIQPAGNLVQLGENVLAGLRLLAPVMGVDASRPWAMGIKLSSGSMFATNNVVFAQFWHGAELPHDVVIPSAAVHELLRVGEPPSAVQMTDRTVTFWFGDERYITTILLEGSLWPLSKIEELMDQPGGERYQLPAEFFDALATLAPFADDKTTRVFLTPTGLSTSLTEGDGATVELAVAGVTEPQAYNLKQLATIKTVATHVDWSTYPRPCKFHHQDHPVRGAIAGQRF